MIMWAVIVWWLADFGGRYWVTELSCGRLLAGDWLMSGVDIRLLDDHVGGY